MRRSLDWEDGRVVADICSTMSGVVLSVLGAGDVALTLSCLSNVELRLVSDEPVEFALFEIKYTAMRHLHSDNVYNLFGVHPAGRRIYVYHQLRPHLSEFTRQWWDQREHILREGLIHAGQTEQGHRRFRQWAQRLHLNLHANRKTKSLGRRASLLQRAFPLLSLSKLSALEPNSPYSHMVLNDVWSPEALEHGPASLSQKMMADVRAGSSKWSSQNQSMECALTAQASDSLAGCYLGALSQRHNVQRLFELLKSRLTSGGTVLCWSGPRPSDEVFEWQRVPASTQSVHSGDLWRGTHLRP